MKTKGVIKLRVSDEDIIFTTNCSKEAFIELTKVFIGESSSYCFISSMHFDEALTDEELIKLTSIE
jgi:hypothetical protein